MRSEGPLHVLGLIGPVLSWVEALEAQALPRGWRVEAEERAPWLGVDSTAVTAQERAWLLHELPTYSLDNVDDVVDHTRSARPGPAGHERWLPPIVRLSPPEGFDLGEVFERLAERYLVWNSGRVSIRAGRMVELHELGLRLPLGLIVRHT